MKRILQLLLVLALVAAAVAAYLYFRVIGPAMVPADREEAVIVTIPTGGSFEGLLDSLAAKGILEDATVFTTLAERMNYKRDRVRAGRYALQPGWNMVRVIRHLRSGAQAPVDVILTNEREPVNVAAKAARFLEPDSAAIAQLLTNEAYLDSIGYTKETIQSIFIPNTYELFWNTTPRGFVERMLREHGIFWSRDKRREKAEALNMTPTEVYTLASIVEKETLNNDEKPRMAGVYLNRLRLGMLLQADPTAVFATRDFDTPRVLYYHTEFDSPYNTYKYAGLPPGPIAMASISSIDGVLNAEDHNYIFFCARGDGSGYHNFAETMAGHSRNIQVYRDNLRRRGLR